MPILNLTQHLSSPAQKDAGVIEPEDRNGFGKGEIKALLTFTEIPTPKEISRRAKALAEIASDSHLKWNPDLGRSVGCSAAMIGGAPYLMGELEKALKAQGVQPLYAFSQRESVELPDGTKKSVFKHLGFVEV